MAVEFVRLARDEKNYGAKSLLESQISLLTIIKRHKAFQRLRKEELNLKLELKRKTEEVKEELQVLDQVLPKSRLHDEQLKEEAFKTKVNKEAKSAPTIEKSEEPKSSLEKEIEEIKRRLEKLQ